MTYECIGCSANTVRCLLDLGLQPPSNRYLLDRSELAESHLLRFGVCSFCGLAQLIDPMPAINVKSHFSWIAYNEPEGHLDSLVELIEDLGFLTRDTFVLGLTYKDDTTLARCHAKGVKGIYRLDQSEDLGICDSLASLETIQESLDLKCVNEFVSKYGYADVLIVRHILEHAHNPQRFLEACSRLSRPGGLIVIEVPDCQKIFDGKNHCFVWEEHISYFTPETLNNLLQTAGFENIDIRVYPYPVEDSLVAIVANNNSHPPQRDLLVSAESISSVENFASSFTEKKTATESLLDEWLQQGCRVALFGAGHLATKFVNFYGLGGRFVGVIDDNPYKQKYFLPGSALPVIDSTCLDKGEIDLCLLTLGLESELKIRKSKATFLEHGGEFKSIFSASNASIYKELPDDPA